MVHAAFYFTMSYIMDRQKTLYTRDVQLILYRGPHFDLKWTEPVKLHNKCIKLQERFF